MSLGQKLEMLKIRSTSVIFLSLHDLKAAPEETMHVWSYVFEKETSIQS